MSSHRLSPGSLIIIAFILLFTSACDGPGTLIPTDPPPPTRAPVTATYTPTPTPWPTDTAAPTDTATPAPTATASATPTPPPSATPTEAATATPAPSVTPAPIQAPTKADPPMATAVPAATEAVRSAEVSIGGCPGGCTESSPACQIKGNINSKGEKIYHMPGQRYYEQTQIKPEDGERWFCTEDEAVAAGWRKSKQ